MIKKIINFGCFWLATLLICSNVLLANDSANLARQLSVKQRDFKQLLKDFASSLSELEHTKSAFEEERENSQLLAMRVQDLGARLWQAQTNLRCKEQQTQDLTASLIKEKDHSRGNLQSALQLQAQAIRTEGELAKQLEDLTAQNQTKIEQLEIERQQLQRALNEAKSRVAGDDLVVQNGLLTAKQQQMEAEFAQLTQHLEQLRAHNQNIRQDFAQKEQLFKTHAKSTVDTLQQRITAQQQDLAAMDEQLFAVRQDKDALAKQMFDAQQENRSIRRRQADTTLQFLQDRVKIEETLGSKLAQVRELVVNKYDHKKLLAKNLGQQKSELLSKLTSLEQDNQAMAQQLAKLSHDLVSSKAKSKQAITTLLDRLQSEQLTYAKQLGALKELASSKVVAKDQQLQQYNQKFEQLMQDLARQKQLYSQTFQDLKVAQANLEILKTAANAEKMAAIDPEQQLLAKKMAGEVEKLERKLQSTNQREQSLFEKLKIAQQEASILRKSVDEVFAKNEILLAENAQLQKKMAASEQSLLALKDQARELTKREAELVEKVINIEQQVVPGKDRSGQMEKRLELARADYANLKKEVQALTEKLSSSSQTAQQLSAQAKEYQQQMFAINDSLANKELQLEELKDKMRSLLANVGLQMELLADECRHDYLRLVTDYQLEQLSNSVLRQGKARMVAELQQLLDDDALMSSLVSRLQQQLQTLQNSSQQSNFGIIFQGLGKNNLLAEMSKLYEMFLARASAGKTANQAFNQFAQLMANYFGEPELAEVSITSLSNPQNLILVKLVG